MKMKDADSREECKEQNEFWFSPPIARRSRLLRLSFLATCCEQAHFRALGGIGWGSRNVGKSSKPAEPYQGETVKLSVVAPERTEIAISSHRVSWNVSASSPADKAEPSSYLRLTFRSPSKATMLVEYWCIFLQLRCNGLQGVKIEI